MSETTTLPARVETERMSRIQLAVESYRDAKRTGPSEIAQWRPPLASADLAVLRDAGTIRARARDLVRNNAFAKNAVRMNRDAVSGSGVKLALKIDWRTLGITDIEVAAEWQGHVSRAWEAHAEGFDFQSDARRQRTFSQLFALADITDFVDGESLSVIEMKTGHGIYQTCLNMVDVDRLTNPEATPDSNTIRGGVERDIYGEPLAYYIRNGHPRDVAAQLAQFSWSRVPRVTSWGRPVVLHTYDHARPEMTRGVSEFASAIVPMKMLSQYEDTELQSAIVQAAYAAVIKTELDWTQAMSVIGAKAASNSASSGNPLFDLVMGHMVGAADYAQKRDLTFRGVEIPHLLPNESLEVVKSTHPNSNFKDFESAFLRQLAAGLGVEAHELSKNYNEVNYSSARTALAAVWRTYRTRRTRIINQFAMPFFGAWLEEAVMLGTVPLPPGVNDFLAAKPFLVRGTFIAWGKPLIDPLKERQGQQLGMQIGVETMEEIAAEEGHDWRDMLDQQAYERSVRAKLGLPDVSGLPMAAPAVPVDPTSEG